MQTKEILKLLDQRNRHKWVVTYMDDWKTEIDLDESIKKLRELIKNGKRINK